MKKLFITLLNKLHNFTGSSFTILINILEGNSKILKYYKDYRLTKLFYKLSFFKKYFTFWRYFRLLMKGILLVNILISIYIFYMFTDFNYNSFYTSIAQFITLSYLYDHNIIIYHLRKFINYILNNYNFNFIKIIKQKVNDIIIPSSPDDTYQLPINDLNDKSKTFQYPYLTILLIIILFSFTYTYWDNIIEHSGSYYDYITTKLVHFGIYRSYLFISDPFIKIYRFFFNSNNKPDNPGSNPDDISTSLLGPSNPWIPKSGDLIYTDDELSKYFKHPNSPDSPTSSGSLTPTPSSSKGKEVDL